MRNVLKYSLLAGSAILPGVLSSYYLMKRILPWWMDAGNWLKYTHAILGNYWPMWDISPFHYPPLYFFVLILFSKLLMDEILALKISSILLFSSIPISTYVLVKTIFLNDTIAIFVAWFISLSPITIEILGWGGYPNLLSLMLLPLAFASILLSLRHAKAKYVLIMILSCVSVSFAHYLTALVFCFTLAIWFLFLFISGKRQRSWVLILAGLAVVISLLPIQIVMFLSGNYNISNDVVLQRFGVPTPEFFVWLFKNAAFLILAVISSIVGTSLILLHRGKDTEMSLLISWILSSFILSQLGFLGIALDYQRILLHFFQPFSILVATPLYLLEHKGLELEKILNFRLIDIAKNSLKSFFTGFLKLLFPITLLISILCLTLSLVVGFGTLYSVDSWYNGIDPYGDEEKLEMLKFVLANTDPWDIFVAEDSMARWLEGYAQRRVVVHHSPMYLFLKGEIEREYIARAIFLSTRGIRTQYSWILDQFPHGHMSPIIGLYVKGDYENMLYLDESTSYITCLNMENGTSFRTYLKDFKVRRGGFGDYFLSATYEWGPIRIHRVAATTLNTSEVKLFFDVELLVPNCRLIELVVDLAKWDRRSFFETWLEPVNNAEKPLLRIITDMGDIYVYSNSDEAFPFVFKPSSDGRITGLISVKLKDETKSAFDPLIYESKSLLSQNRIKYTVIPIKTYVGDFRMTRLEIQSLSEYNHLLRNPDFKIVHINRRIALLSINTP